MKKLLLLALLLIPSFLHAQCAGVTSCTAAGVDSTSVQNALNSINQENTVLKIPGGSATWTSRVSYNGAFSITVQGQTTVVGTCAPGGTCTATDTTIITDALTGRPSGCGTGDGSVFSITTTLGKTIRITGLTFRYSGPGTCLGSVIVGGTGQATRFDHNHFNGNTFVAIGWTGWTYGVVDHNLFDVASGTWNAVKFEENNYVDPGSGLPDNLNVGDGAWADNTNFGTTKAVYVENNNFNWGPTGVNNGSGYMDDCTSGGRFVIRFNLITNAMVQTHPTGGGQRHRGCRMEEVYQNTFNGTNGAANDFNAFWLSSGSALVWGNTVSGNGYNEFVTVHSMRRTGGPSCGDPNGTYCQGATPSGWGYCGTSFTGTGSNWDQNSNVSSGRKCIDRPGMGKGDRLINDFPNLTNNATGCTSAASCAWLREQLEPVYEWLNNASGVNFFWNVTNGELLANEDYYNYTTSGFTGASGVGSGTLAAMPASCTNNPDAGGIGGTAYWATDQGNWNQSGNGAGNGVLYHCVGGVFTSYYTPLTYPHPLTQQTGWTWIQDNALVFCSGRGSVNNCSATIGNIAPTTPGSVWVLYMQTTNHVTITSVCNGVGCTGTNNGWVHCPNCNAYNPNAVVGGQTIGMNVDAFYNLPPVGPDTRVSPNVNMNILLSGVSGQVFGGGFIEVLPPPGTTATLDDSNIAAPNNCTACVGPTLTNVTGTDAIIGNPGGLSDTAWNETSAPYFTSSNGSPVGLNLTSGAPWTRQSPANSNPEFFEMAFKSSAGIFIPPTKQYSIVNFTATSVNSCSGSCTVTLSAPTTAAGHLLFMQAYGGGGDLISSITGSGWVIPAACKQTGSWGGNNNGLSCAYNLSAPQGLSSITLSMTSTNAANFAIFEIASTSGGSFNIDAVNSLSNTNAGGSYYLNGPSMTLAGANDVIFQASVVGGGSLGPTNYPIPAIPKVQPVLIGPFNYFFQNQAAITVLTDSGPLQTALGLGANAPVANWINPQHNNILATSIAFSLSGSTPTTPTVSFSQSSVSFGNVPVGTAAPPQSVTLTNTGTGTLTISNMTLASPFTFSTSPASNCGGSLAPSATCTITFNYTPTSAVTSNNTFSMASNASTSPDNIAVSGTGTALPAVSFNPTSINFGNVCVGTAASPIISTLKNTGTGTLTISGMSLGSPFTFSTSPASNCGGSLAPSATCAITINYTPTALVTSNNTFSMVSNSPTSPDTVPITGTGVVPAAPTFFPTAGAYTSPQNVTITASLSGGVICYTNDGTIPTANGAGTCTTGTTLANGGSVTVPFSELLQAISSESGFPDSSLGSASYVFSTSPAAQVFAQSIIFTLGII